MKIDRSAARERRWRKQKQLTAWHRWFAWYPVSTTAREFIWLEQVERKYVYHIFGGHWKYRRTS